jgi:hypothetical protein
MFEIIITTIDNVQLSIPFTGTKEQAERYAFDLYIDNVLLAHYEVVPMQTT